ncbi:alpha/beta hydrolase-fold protein [Flavivirga rizhaonensis]|uniref:O-antigen ligase-related domain-containing protein n=1 Tax=Flavivirga rizhaonensis TaxID=2559571 RepID=A0A4S1DVL7_9FLAO|nr:alpha/beta hydrolase-fold protein [Flavivirga rizhaonensis]TGV02137.1 hypothetical protein EM932_12275 [Flavivirga rizhaonensis]
MVLITCIIESGIALLQYFEVIETSNDYFKLLGSFKTPNFLGAYLGIGFSCLMWFFIVNKIEQKNMLIIGAICFLFIGIIIVITNSRSTWLSLLCSMIVLFITSKKSKQVLKKLPIATKIIGAVLFIVISIFASKFLYSLKPESVNGRALVAKITLQEIGKKPILGHGLFSFSGGYNRAKADYFLEAERSWEEIKNASYVFTPFNDYLLIAYEFGLLALFISFSMILYLIIKMKINPKTRLGCVLLVSVSVLALFTSPSSNFLLMFLGLLGLALIVTFGNFKVFILRLNKHLIYGMRLSFIILALASFYILINKGIGIKHFRDYTLSNKKALDREKIISLSMFTYNHGFSDAHLGKLLYDSGYKEDGYKYMEKAFFISSAPRIGKLLASYYIKDGNYKKAEEIYRLNIATEPYRYEGQMDLLSLMDKTNRYLEFTKIADKIINFPVKVPSEKVNNYKKIANLKAKKYSKLINSLPDLKGSLSNGKLVNSPILKKALPYKIYLPPIDKINKKLPVIYINDGYSYIRKGRLAKTLDSLIVNNIIKPVAAIFLDPRDKNENWKNIRQELFLCNPHFVDFFTDELIPKIEKLYPVSNNRKDRTILGVSFGGLAASYLGDQVPHIFKNIAMQSPAFHTCPDIYKSYELKPKKDLKIYLSFGTGRDTEKQDIPMVNILKSKGYELKVDIIENGGHNWNIWKEQLDNILVYFYGTPELPQTNQ